MQTISKEEFFAADDLSNEAVPLPESYGEDRCLYVRSMTGTERASLEKQFMAEDARSHPGKFRAAVLTRCVVTEAGEPLFTGDDAKRVMGKHAGTLETIFEKACTLNGLTKKDVEDLEKNSEESR